MMFKDDFLREIRTIVREEIEQEIQNNLLARQKNRDEDLIKNIDEIVERWTWERFKRFDRKIDLLMQAREDEIETINRHIDKLNETFDQKNEDNIQALKSSILELQKEGRQQILNINNTIERWTWERYKRVRQDLSSLLFEILFEFSPKRITDFFCHSAIYDYQFYWTNRLNSVKSASVILGELISWLGIKSVVDFGCGTGTWLWVAQNMGVDEILGIDGGYVPDAMKMIPREKFVSHDLNLPISLTHKYDLAISLETAEHLAESSAEFFVESLTDASDIVLFSAAHPGQGGDGHINEQPMEYWIEKFDHRKYQYIGIQDCIKNDSGVMPWYKENVGLYVYHGKFENVKSMINNNKHVIMTDDNKSFSVRPRR